MTTDDYLAHKDAVVAAYEAKNALLYEQAVAALATEFARQPELVADLKARIAEKPDWLGGRDDAPCWWCNCELGKRETCRMCQGTGRSREFPLHMGFGMSVRNRLRTLGFTEAVMGFDNWDDYYGTVVERAVARL